MLHTFPRLLARARRACPAFLFLISVGVFSSNLVVAQTDDEMGMDDYGYGDEFGDDGSGQGPAEYGYGDQSGRGSSSGMRGGSNMNLQQQMFGQAASAFQSPGWRMLFSNEEAPVVESGPVLNNEALIAYSMGDQDLARKLFFGHIVAEFDDASDALRNVRYSRVMKRPAWGVLWGISFTVRGEATDPQPLDESSSAGGMRGGFGDDFGGGMDMGMDMGMGMGMDGGGPAGMGRGGMGGRGGPGGAGMGMDEDQSGGGMDDMMMGGGMGGDMMMDGGAGMGRGMGMGGGMGRGMEMGDGMGMGMDGGMGRGMGMGSGARGGSAPANNGPAARLAGMRRPMLNPESDAELRRVSGLVATVLAEQFATRFGRGDFGEGLNDITPESGNRDSVSDSFVNLLESAEPVPLWQPGLVYVGEGESRDMAANARRMGLDLVLHLDILLKPRGEDFTENSCRVRILHAPTGKSLGVSKPVNTLEFQQRSRAKGTKARDYVSEQLANLWGIVDRETIAMSRI